MDVVPSQVITSTFSAIYGVVKIVGLGVCYLLVVVLVNHVYSNREIKVDLVKVTVVV